MNTQQMSANSGRLRRYAQVGVQSGLEAATPHRLILMLLEGALTRIARAVGHLQRGETAARGQNISLAISIIGGLRGSLNHGEGGVIAENLDELYGYMIDRLLHANLRGDAEALREVQNLLSEIRAGWIAIAPAATAPAPAHG
jgi:flagellar protein FliS